MYNKNVWIKLKTNHIFCSLHLFSVWPSQWYCARVNTFNGFGWKYTELNILSKNKSTQNIQQTCGISPYIAGDFIVYTSELKYPKQKEVEMQIIRPIFDRFCKKKKKHTHKSLQFLKVYDEHVFVNFLQFSRLHDRWETAFSVFKFSLLRIAYSI